MTLQIAPRGMEFEALVCPVVRLLGTGLADGVGRHLARLAVGEPYPDTHAVQPFTFKRYLQRQQFTIPAGLSPKYLARRGTMIAFHYVAVTIYQAQGPPYELKHFDSPQFRGLGR